MAMAEQCGFFERHSRAFNIVTTIFLAVVCLAMYMIITLLYISPATFSRDSFLQPSGQPSPQVIVSICAAILSASTGALVTRCVEHYFWLKLAPSAEGARSLTMGEVRDLAEWTVSPLKRFLYVFTGSSWALKPAGILLIATAFLNAVLLAGISEANIESRTESYQAPTATVFRGWFDQSNSRYNGGGARDVPSYVAATVSLSNLTAPAANTNCGANTSCRASAVVAAIHAICTSRTFDNTETPAGCICNASGTRTLHSETDSIFMSDYGVTLTTGSPYTFANFSTAYIGGTYVPTSSGGYGELSADGGPGGGFAIILGAWTASEVSPPAPINVVDCRLEFGTKTLTQDGDQTPQLALDSFEKSNIQLTESGLFPIARIYGEFDFSPWSFTGGAVGTGSNTLFESPIGFMLLGESASASADVVAARIEKALEMATLMAWSRSPESAEVIYTTTSVRRIYVYQRYVLGMLLVPLLATVLGVVGKWRIGGVDKVLGYNPMAIAGRGPVVGVERLWEGLSTEFEGRKVIGVAWEQEGGGRRRGFMCLDPGPELVQVEVPRRGK